MHRGMKSQGGGSGPAENKRDQHKQGKSVCVVTNGCPENRIDGAGMLEFLKENGFTSKTDFHDADIIVFNSCALTHSCQEESMAIIEHIQTQKKPSAELIVCGCLPKINVQRLREVYRGITFGSDEIEALAKVVETKTSPQGIFSNSLLPRIGTPVPHRHHLRRLWKVLNPISVRNLLVGRLHQRLLRSTDVFNSQTFNIKVCTGCLNVCAFCAVKLSRGQLRSKPIGDVVKEFEKGLAEGKTEFALLGTEVGAYGIDRGETLVDLLSELVKRKGEYKIRLRNIHPSSLIKMMPEFQEILRTGRILYLSSPVQSGNNRILKRMRRNYEVAEFTQAINTLKREFPEIQIRTQILVGFPGETEDEFQDTLRLLDELDVDAVEVYAFQPRPTTEAAKMEDQLQQDVIRKRHQIACMKSVWIGLKKKLGRAISLRRRHANPGMRRQESRMSVQADRL